MTDVERALRDSLNLYLKNPVFIIPHFVEFLLTLATLLTVVVTVIMAVGVHFTDLEIADSELFASQIVGGGAGLIFIILLTLFFGFFIISIVKAMATAAVVGMADSGFKDIKVSLGVGFESAKKHFIKIFLLWLLIGVVLFSILAASFFPAILSALLNLSEVFKIATILFGFFLSALVSIVFYIGVLFSVQLIVIKEQGIFESVKDSMEFVRSNIAAVLVYIAVVTVFNFLLFFFFGILSFLPNIFYRGSEFFGLFLDLFINLLSIASSLIIAPYFEIVKTRLVLDWTK